MLEIRTPYTHSVCPFLTEQMVFFDIETTGLSAKSSILYLIGIIKKEQNHWTVIQLFNDDGESESEVILRFFQLLPKEAVLIHYNGTTFDLPYLKTRCELLHLSSDPLTFATQFDYYSFLKPFKSLLQLSDCKQHTMEKITGFERTDTLSGKKLIEQYFLHLKLQKDCYKEALLLHNFDDLTGLIRLSYFIFFKEQLKQPLCFWDTVVSSDEIQFQLPLSSKFPDDFLEEVSFTKQFDPAALKKKKREESTNLFTIKFTVTKELFFIACPILNDTLKFFYPNYRDYFYLPLEDMAIHKSVASFVDKDHRIKAKPDTCYTKKTGYFLPVFPPFSSFEEHSIPIFYKDYPFKQGWILFDPSASPLTQQLWLENILQYFKLFH